ncbi:MAG TPA: hypothetical protein VMI53_08625 [Opitutaceae bacterium]|nr:hypothetical protein [Opitutaceae bacterium]
MPPRRAVAGFLGRFALVYGLLIFPWPGWNGFYGRGFRALGRTVFAENSGRRILRFEPAPDTLRPLDTAIALANREQLDALGSGPVRTLGLDTRGVGWVPTALLLALILATPVSWRRRGRALIWGLICLYVFILFSVGIYIWNESAQLSLVGFSPFWKAIADGLEETLITQMGASFVAPVLIWILVTFRREDILAWAGDGNPAPD